MLWGLLLLLSFPLNAGNISFVSSSHFIFIQKTISNNWMFDTWRKMNWLDEVDRLGDIESSPVSYNICFVNAPKYLVQSKERMEQTQTYAVRKNQHSPPCIFMPNILPFYCRDDGPLFVWSIVDALKRSPEHTDTWGLLIAAAFFFASCHNRHICLWYYDIICKMIFSNCDIVFEHSFPALFVRLAHVGPVLLVFLFSPYFRVKKEGSPIFFYQLHKKVFISQKYIC